MVEDSRQPLDVSDWEYRAEGHANIILAHKTRPEVLRLRKRVIPTEGDGAESQTDSAAVARQQCLDQMMYHNNIMQPLLGPEYVFHVNLVRVPPGFVEEVNKRWIASRPSYRLIKEGDPSWDCALLLPDVSALPQHTQSNNSLEGADCYREQPVAGLATDSSSGNQAPTFCIEVKPKWGFLPTSQQSHRGDGIQLTHCRFCLFQQLKVSEGKWECPSLYCPLDLFSGNKLRLLHTVYSLLQTPQNNIRIFKNGRQIFKADPNGMAAEQSLQCLVDNCEGCFSGVTSDDEEYFHLLCDNFRQKCTPSLRRLVSVIVHILLDDANQPHHLFGHSPPPVLDSLPLCEAGVLRGLVNNGHLADVPAIPAKVGGALNTIRVVQMLDDLGIEHMHRLWKSVNEQINSDPLLREKWQNDCLFDSDAWKGLPSLLGQLDQSVDTSVAYAMRKVREFTVASTAKDCSIMVAFRGCLPDQVPCGPRTVDVPSDDGHVHVDYRMSIVDLDIKGPERIEKYEQEDKAIIKHYISKFKRPTQ